MDTAAREKEIEEKLLKEKERKEVRGHSTTLPHSRTATLEVPLYFTKNSSLPNEQGREKEQKISIFGAARPVDTASREREIEERLQQKREQLERELEEKKKERRREREDRRSEGGR